MSKKHKLRGGRSVGTCSAVGLAMPATLEEIKPTSFLCHAQRNRSKPKTSEPKRIQQVGCERCAAPYRPTPRAASSRVSCVSREPCAVALAAHGLMTPFLRSHAASWVWAPRSSERFREVWGGRSHRSNQLQWLKGADDA